MPGLTPRDTELMAIAFRCIDTKSVVLDWDLFIQLAGLKNINTARTVYGQLKRKLNDSITDTAGNVTVGTPTKAAAVTTRKVKTPKKRAAQENAEDQQTKDEQSSKKIKTEMSSDAVNAGAHFTPADHFLTDLGAFAGDPTGWTEGVGDGGDNMFGHHGDGFGGSGL